MYRAVGRSPDHKISIFSKKKKKKESYDGITSLAAVRFISKSPRENSALDFTSLSATLQPISKKKKTGFSFWMSNYPEGSHYGCKHQGCVILICVLSVTATQRETTIQKSERKKPHRGALFLNR